MQNMENTKITGWLDILEKAKAQSKGTKKYAQLIKLASRPKRHRVSVNLDKLNKLANDNESIIVPGKVLGIGNMSKKINISAISFSGNAKEKLKASKCSIVKIEDMLKDKNARIII